MIISPNYIQENATVLGDKNVMFRVIWYHSYNFKKGEKDQWRSVTFSKVEGLVTLPMGVFHIF